LSFSSCFSFPVIPLLSFHHPFLHTPKPFQSTFSNYSYNNWTFNFFNYIGARGGAVG
jgi:hypothetical protein